MRPFVRADDTNGHKLRGAFAAPDDGDGKLFRDCAQSRLERRVQRLIDDNPARTARHRKHGVVGRALSVDGDGVERVAGHRGKCPPKHRRLHLRVTREKSQHRRHQRFNHAGSLGHAADVKRAGRCLDLDCRLLWKRVCRHDREHRVVMGIAAEHRKRLRDAVLYFLQAEINADNAGRCDEHLLGTALHLTSDELHSGARHSHARVSSARVGASAIADDRLGAAARHFEIRARDQHRRSLRFVGRKHGRSRHRAVGRHHHDVERPGMRRRLDAGIDACGPEARRRCNAAFDCLDSSFRASGRVRHATERRAGPRALHQGRSPSRIVRTAGRARSSCNRP